MITRRFSGLRLLTRGMGGMGAVLLTSGMLTFRILIEEIRESIGRSSKSLLPEYSDIVPDIVKIRVILEAVNNNPLDNPLIRAMTSLVVRNDLLMRANLESIKVRESSSPTIIIKDKRISNE